MTNDDEFRKTLRLTKYQDEKLKRILKAGKHLTEAELIRQALNIGLDVIEGEMHNEH